MIFLSSKVKRGFRSKSATLLEMAGVGATLGLFQFSSSWCQWQIRVLVHMISDTLPPLFCDVSAAPEI